MITANLEQLPSYPRDFDKQFIKISMNQPSIGPGLDDHCSDGEVFLAVGIFRFSQCPEFWGEHFPFVKNNLCGNSFGC